MVCALLGAPAFAQDAAPGVATSGSETSEGSNLTAKEMKSGAESRLVEIRQALARATEVLEEARDAKDIVQLNCVNEKLTQIKGLLRIAEDSSVALYESLASGQTAISEHQFQKLTIAHEKVQVVRSELEQCAGEASIYTGETTVAVETEGDVEEADPTDTPLPPPAPEFPAVSSPF